MIVKARPGEDCLVLVVHGVDEETARKKLKTPPNRHPAKALARMAEDKPFTLALVKPDGSFAEWEPEGRATVGRA